MSSPAPSDRLIRGALAPLEALRRSLWRLGTTVPLGRTALRDRSTRLTLVALAHITVTLGIAALSPLWLLLLGPLILGVPHVASDLRYLLLSRRGLGQPLTQPGVVMVLALLAGMTLVRVIALLGGGYNPGLEVGVGGATVAAAIALSRGTPTAKAVGLTITGALTAFGLSAPSTTALLIAHLHNAVAFGLWLWIARPTQKKGHAALVALAYVAACTLILGGGLDGLAPAAFGADAAGLDFDTVAWTLAPGLDPVWATRLVVLFAFAQAIHYTVWLRLMPQQHLARQTPPTLAKTARGWIDAFGPAMMTLIVVTAAAVPLLGLVAPLDTRNTYLSLALFHGWLEFAVIGAALASGRRATTASPA